MEFATIKKVRLLFNYEISDSTASRYINLVRICFDIHKPRKVPLDKIKEYYGIKSE